jgi:iron(III) transport system substrate-binding protein
MMRSLRSAKTVTLTLLTALVLSVVAIAIAPAAAAWQDSPEVKKLYEAAKKEGKVIVWGTQRREVEWIPAAFGAMFPGIEVQVLGDNEIATRAISEARAGRHQVDVFWHSLTGTMALVQRDLLTTNDWAPFGVVKENTAFDGKMGFTSNIVYTFVYNTRLVNEADVPKNWNDVFDPRLKGKMAASMFLAPRFVGALGIAWGEEKALQYARDLREKTDILLTRAPRESLLQSGERVISIGEVDSQVRAWIAEGLPIAFVVPEPVIVGQFGACVVAKAPNPNAARLMAGYLASQDGKKAREKATFQSDYGPTSDNELAKRLHAGKTQVVHDTVQIMAAKEALYPKAASILTGQAK